MLKFRPIFTRSLPTPLFKLFGKFNLESLEMHFGLTSTFLHLYINKLLRLLIFPNSLFIMTSHSILSKCMFFNLGNPFLYSTMLSLIWACLIISLLFKTLRLHPFNLGMSWSKRLSSDKIQEVWDSSSLVLCSMYWIFSSLRILYLRRWGSLLKELRHLHSLRLDIQICTRFGSGQWCPFCHSTRYNLLYVFRFFNCRLGIRPSIKISLSFMLPLQNSNLMVLSFSMFFNLTHVSLTFHVNCWGNSDKQHC